MTPPSDGRSHTVESSCLAVSSGVEVSRRLVGSPAFKAGGTGDPRPAGSFPVHLRHEGYARFLIWSENLPFLRLSRDAGLLYSFLARSSVPDNVDTHEGGESRHDKHDAACGLT